MAVAVGPVGVAAAVGWTVAILSGGEKADACGGDGVFGVAGTSAGEETVTLEAPAAAGRGSGGCVVGGWRGRPAETTRVGVETGSV